MSKKKRKKNTDTYLAWFYQRRAKAPKRRVCFAKGTSGL